MGPKVSKNTLNRKRSVSSRKSSRSRPKTVREKIKNGALTIQIQEPPSPNSAYNPNNISFGGK